MGKKSVIIGTAMVLAAALSNVAFGQKQPSNMHPGFPGKSASFTVMKPAERQKMAGLAQADYGRQLTASPYFKMTTDFSPDGQWITWAQGNDEGVYDVWIMPAVGGTPVNLTADVAGTCYFPTFRNDSKAVLYTLFDDTGLSLWNVTIDTLQKNAVRKNAANCQWSHNGQYLLFRIGDTGQLAIFDAKAVKEWIIDEDPSYGLSCFTPDDMYVITTRSDNTLWRIPVMGGAPEQATPYAGLQWYPDISPDGKWLMFTIWPDTYWVDAFLAAYDMTTGDFIAVYPDMTTQNYCGSFSRDGSRISYLQEVNGVFQVFVAPNPLGGGPVGPSEIVMIPIPSGTFQMGDVEGIGFDNEKPVHTVTISSFEMSAYEITNKQYAEYLNKLLSSGDISATSSNVIGKTGEYSGLEYINLSGFESNNKCMILFDNGIFSVESGKENWPVNYVTWYGAKAFALYYKSALPTEAEWEYAARGGLQNIYGTDNGTIDSSKANYGSSTGENYIGHPVKVGSYPPNPFGLYDMSGNVWEMCNDWYGDYTSDSVTNPTGPQTGSVHVKRGGSWDNSELAVRSAFRVQLPPDGVYANLGFRVVRREEAPKITLLAPNGGERLTAGTPFNITWSASVVTELYLAYSTDGGANWNLIARVKAVDGSFSWTPPDVSSTNCLVRISDSYNMQTNDASDGMFTIEPLVIKNIMVYSPSGGEIWEVGQSYGLSWESSGVEKVNILWQQQNSTTKITIAQGIAASDGYFDWYIDDRFVSDSCQIIIVDATAPTAGTTVQGVSGFFSISKPVVAGEIDLTYPDGGEEFTAGSVMNISWKAVNVPRVNIYCVLSDGSTITVASGVDASTGSFAWKIPEKLESSGSYITVEDAENADVYDWSSGYFSIIAQITPTITVVSPNGGESWTGGTTQTISWTSRGVANVRIDYSVNSGSTWGTVVSSTDAAAGSYKWTVPGANSDRCLIRITSLENVNVVDVSDAVFSIVSGPKITVVSPNGGEPWTAGTTQNITWTSSGVANVRIEYTTDGSNWMVIAASVSATAGSFAWAIPATINSTTCSVRITAALNTSVSDMSDGVFSIASAVTASITVTSPAGGESWEVGQSYTITWESTGAERVNILWQSTADNVKIPIAEGIAASDGYFDWSIDDRFVSESCQIIIVDAAASTTEIPVQGISDFFSITKPAVGGEITVTYPEGGEEFVAGTMMDIKWQATNVSRINIYCVNSDGTQIVVAAPYDASGGLLVWQIPATLKSSGSYIHIEDAENTDVYGISSGYFTIVSPPVPALTLTYPNGGEIFTAKLSLPIAWNAENIATIKIEYTTDSSTWKLIASGVNASDGYYEWTAPEVSSPGGLIRITSEANAGITDTSDGTFTIRSPYLRIVSPNTSETLEVGNDYIITWEARDTYTISIEYSVDDGATWMLIDTGVGADTKSYPWIVPDTPSDQCRVRITDESGSGVSSVSYAKFTIFVPKPEPYLRVVSPNGGDSWTGGTTQNITWTSTGVANVKLEYTTDGSTWSVITSSTSASAGSYAWAIPATINSTTCSVRITAALNASVNDMSDGVFSIAPQSITVTSPAGGESWEVGQSYTIAWESTGAERVNILWQSTADNVKIPIAEGISASDGYFDWSIDDRFVSQSCQIIVMDAATATTATPVQGVSNIFSVFKPVAGGEITVTYPEGGEEFVAGTMMDIKWQATNVSRINIYCVNSDGTQIVVATPYDASGGLLVWQIPATLKSSGSYIHIEDAENTDVYNMSSGYFTIVSPPVPALTLTYPNGGEIFTAKLSLPIGWNAENIAAIKIEYTTDSSTWKLIASGVNASDGYYAWTAPEVSSPGCLIRITDEAIADITDTSDGTFTIRSPYLRIVSPNTSETLEVGNDYIITWEARDTYTITIEYSVDDGATWTLIDTGVGADTKSYSWIVPDKPSNQCRVRITDESGSGVMSVSYAKFTIFVPKPEPYLRVVSPNGGESLEVGASYIMTWEARDVSLVTIEYSTDDGVSWNTVATNIDAATKSLSWIVPDTPSDRCRVRIIDEANTTVVSMSYAVFSIARTDTTPYLRLVSPNGGEKWNVLSTYNITWEARNVDKVNILYTTDDDNERKYWKVIASDIDAAAGSYEWRIPDTPSTKCRVAITKVGDVDTATQSYATFTITRPLNEPWIRLITPNGGDEWQAGTARTIVWESSGSLSLSIRYSMDGAKTWTEIAKGILASTNSFTWEIPGDIASTTCAVWVGDPSYSKRFDTSEKTFVITPAAQEPSITLISPNGGQQWQAGKTYEITWKAELISNVTLWYSGDKGLTWPVIAENLDAASGSFMWTIPPELNVPECYISVSDSQNEKLFDTSNQPFSIIPKPAEKSIIVTTPAESEVWQVGETRTIVWESTGVSKVLIKWFQASDNRTLDVAANVDAAQGSFKWLIGDAFVSESCQIIVVDAVSTDTAALPVRGISKPFIIIPVAPEKFLNLTYPNGGEEFIAGETLLITWESYNINSVNLFCELSDGSVIPIADGVYAPDVSFEWFIPDTLDLTGCVMVIEDAEDLSISDRSEGTFSIVQKVRSITLLSPLGGEEYPAGTNLIINWEAVGIQSIDIYFTSDEWNSEITVAEGVDASSGFYTFRLPENIDSGTCYIWIEDYDTGIFDENLEPFTVYSEVVQPSIMLLSPMGGEEFEPGMSLSISWQAVGVATVDIQYSTDNIQFIFIARGVDASKGSYDWVVPQITTGSTNCYIKVVDSSNRQTYGMNTGPFTIKPPTVQASIEILAPIGGQYAVGDLVTIRWNATGVEKVNINYSIDGRVIFLELESGIDATAGSYTWRIPEGLASKECYFVVTDSTDPGVVAGTTEPIFITAGQAQKSITVISPNGGERLLAGKTYNIIWQSSGVDEVRLFFSTKGGAANSWRSIELRTPSSGLYTWTVPDSVSNNCKIRIMDVGVTTIFDESDAPFSIAPNITNENAKFFLDTDLENAGFQGNAPVTGVKGGDLVAFAIYGAEWATPNTAQFNISWDSNVAVYRKDLSLFKPSGENVTFNGKTIKLSQEPNVMDLFGGTVQKNINEMSGGVFEVSINRTGNVEPSLASGFVYLAVFEIASGFSVGDSLIVDVSGEIFTDQGSKSLGVRKFKAQASDKYVKLLSPIGGEQWAAGSTQYIEWEAKGVSDLYLMFSSESGVADSWYYILEHIDATQYSLVEWTLPEDIDSSDCFIFIGAYDENGDVDENVGEISGLFTIYKEQKALQLTSPNGGQEWNVRSDQDITWTSTAVSQVTIEYSTDGGTKWNAIASNVDASQQSYRWSIPSTASTNCKVRITDASDGTVTDTSDYTFSIVSGNFISVIEPTGGQTWSTGIGYEIKWNFSGVTNIKIELSTDGGLSWQDIKESTTASGGSYKWTIPDIESSECIIRLTDTTNTSLIATSDVFSIMKPQIRIDHQAVAEAKANDSIAFAADVVSDADITEVKIHYDKTGSRKFEDQLDMTLAEGTTYNADLEEGKFTALGMEYYITAKDAAGKETRAPVGEDSFYAVTALVNDIRTAAPVPAGSAQTSYRMVSIPLQLKSTNIVTQLTDRLPPGETGVDWRIFRYAPGSDTPAEYPDIEGFAPGKAFWIIAAEGYNMQAPQGTTVTTAEPFKLELKSGWNDIANPWMFDISWDDIENPSGAELSVLYTYENKWSDPTNSSKIMKPWKGYAVRNLSNLTVIIKLNPEPASVSKPVAETQPADWKISIMAQAGLASDTANHLGVRQDASIGWDRYDHVEPPAVGQYVSVLFPHRDWTTYPYDYTVDFRPSEETMTWEFDVRTNITHERVQVGLVGLDTLPSGYGVTLVDRDTGKPVTISGGSFEFASGDGETQRRFALVVTTRGENGRPETDTQPEQFVTATSYPNPFNPSTTIRYELSAPGHVRIAIFNAVGQRMREYDLGFRAQGIHEFVFDAAGLTTGLYLYRIDSGYAAVTEKMMFMK